MREALEYFEMKAYSYAQVAFLAKNSAIPSSMLGGKLRHSENPEFQEIERQLRMRRHFVGTFFVLAVILTAYLHLGATGYAWLEQEMVRYILAGSTVVSALYCWVSFLKEIDDRRTEGYIGYDLALLQELANLRLGGSIAKDRSIRNRVRNALQVLAVNTSEAILNNDPAAAALQLQFSRALNFAKRRQFAQPDDTMRSLLPEAEAARVVSAA